MNKVRPMSEYGCKECWSCEASEAWKAVTSIPIQAYLIDESHYIVSIRVCPSCSQHYLQVTSETLNWKEGEDPIYLTIIPIDDAERTELTSSKISTPMSSKALGLAGSHSGLIVERIKSRALTGSQAFALVSTTSADLAVRPRDLLLELQPEEEAERRLK